MKKLNALWIRIECEGENCETTSTILGPYEYIELMGVELHTTDGAVVGFYDAPEGVWRIGDVHGEICIYSEAAPC